MTVEPATGISIAADPEETISRAQREAMRGAHLVPLWESPTAYKPDRHGGPAHIWRWRVTRPIMMQTATVASPAVVQRRALSLVDPRSKSPMDESTTRLINAALQMLLPHERAKPHRHSMNALRFVLEGAGAEMIVDGKRCPMTPGDLIITPQWCWHEHVADTGVPTIWMDILDFDLHLFFGTFDFQPGPVVDLPSRVPDAAFRSANVLPCIASEAHACSPVFRYPLADASLALEAAPIGADGTRRVRYVNPLNGRPAMTTLDCTLVQIETSRPTRRFRSSASVVCVAIEGCGESRIGEQVIEWEPNDVFTLPQWNWITHRVQAERARLFMVSNREVYERLSLLTEEYG
jgi:gentisate 1,2-dioxygenase